MKIIYSIITFNQPSLAVFKFNLPFYITSINNIECHSYKGNEYLGIINISDMVFDYPLGSDLAKNNNNVMVGIRNATILTASGATNIVFASTRRLGLYNNIADINLDIVQFNQFTIDVFNQIKEIKAQLLNCFLFQPFETLDNQSVNGTKFQNKRANTLIPFYFYANLAPSPYFGFSGFGQPFEFKWWE